MNSGHQKIDKYLIPLKLLFEEAANPTEAKAMAAYMKAHFPFYGVKSTPRRELARYFIKENGLPQIHEIDVVVKSCFRQDQREYHYFAVDLMIRLVKKLGSERMELAHWMVVNKSWWDTVDAIASNIVGPLVMDNPSLTEKMDEFIEDENMWLQRTAILFQLKFKEKTNSERLYNYCASLADDNRFFIKKAIGWALREYSKTEKKSVQEFVNNTPLSTFSKKEALKWINKNC